MELYRLLNGITILGGEKNLYIEISNIVSDSRKRTINGAFVAIKGEKRNGNNYINQAVLNGAVVIITDDKESFDRYKNTILVENSRKALSHMWNNFYNNPTKDMTVIAITGTNGKTSCAYHMYSILKASGVQRGLISTIECLINDNKIETNGGTDVIDMHSAMTTPDPEVLYALFNEMNKNCVKYVVMEASSHALAQEKLSPICAKYAIFTNLSPEHLDFHKNLEEYYQAKKKLFKSDTTAVICIDDSYGERLSKEVKKAFSCSIKKKAYFEAKNVEIFQNGYKYSVRDDNSIHMINGNIGGEFSVSNSLLCIGCASLMGMDMEKIAIGISSLEKILGRFERIEGSNILIDYAHTPYAMERVLEELRKIRPQGKIFVLFGCGGDRDRQKRKLMGKIASQKANFCIITNDNSRSERSLDIIMEILSGVEDGCEIAVIPNREKAIIYAMSQMNDENDTLILLGKGHEQYEIDKTGKHYFNEREIVRRELENDKNKKLYGFSNS